MPNGPTTISPVNNNPMATASNAGPSLKGATDVSGGIVTLSNGTQGTFLTLLDEVSNAGKLQLAFQVPGIFSQVAPADPNAASNAIVQKSARDSQYQTQTQMVAIMGQALQQMIPMLESAFKKIKGGLGKLFGGGGGDG